MTDNPALLSWYTQIGHEKNGSEGFTLRQKRAVIRTATLAIEETLVMWKLHARPVESLEQHHVLI